MSSIIIDLNLDFQSDIDLSVTNDLGLVNNSGVLVLDKDGDSHDYYQQHITRLLATIPGQYIWQPKYGVGAEADIGQPMSTKRLDTIHSSVMQGLYQIPGILSPVVTVTPYPGSNYIQVVITYKITATQTQKTNTFLIQA